MSIAPARVSSSNRWTQLVLGIICMASVANLQYGWTLFVLPIQHQWGWTKAEIQVAFSIFILLETWLVPFEGAIVDRIGPRWMVLAGGVGTFIAWFVDSRATSLGMLYLGGAIAGFAGGAVYGTCVGNALKWFPDKRGLCGGLTAAGFGAGAAITIAPIRSMIETSGYQLRHHVHGQRRCLAARSARQRSDPRHRKLARGLCRRMRDERGRVIARLLHPETNHKRAARNSRESECRRSQLPEWRNEEAACGRIVTCSPARFRAWDFASFDGETQCRPTYRLRPNLPLSPTSGLSRFFRFCRGWLACFLLTNIRRLRAHSP
jgi:hypothetical protein